MDVAALSMGLSQANLLNSVGTAVLSKSLEQSKDMGGALTELIDASSLEHSVHPELGGNIDLRI